MSASRPFGRSLLAIGLCLLAFSFAMEAKLAGYGPRGGPASDVSAAKALPADVPDLVPHGVPAPDPFHPQVPIAFLLTLAAGCVLMDVQLKLQSARAHLPVSAASYFSPNAFFRPPPAN
jgi:hypothetical protein